MLKSGVFGICCVCATLAAQTYVPQNVGEFYPEPGKTARLTVKAGEGAALPESLSYSLLDYSGKNVGSGMFKRKGETLETSLSLNRGFYELDLGKQRIGLSVLEPSSRVPDRFFALETLLNYDSPEKIRQMMAVLKKAGIATIREYHHWNQEEKEPGKWDVRREKLYPLAREFGIEVTSFLGAPPRWTGAFIDTDKRNAAFQPYPRELFKVGDSIRSMIERRRPALGSFQIGNEPDLQFFPGDSSIPLLAASSWFMRDSGIPLVLAAFSGASEQRNPAVMRPYFESGLLDYGDVFAFHSYHSPETMIELVRFYRGWMKEYRKGGMPIWITECGKAWSRGIVPKRTYGPPYGRERAPVNEDKLSALWIVMKGVEAKAAGIERFFPFCLRFFAEGVNNFGMTDFRGTPHRSLHAYFNSVLILSGKEYVGDLKKKPAPVKAARVFSNGADSVIVLYTGTVEPRWISTEGIPFTEAFAIDGTPIKAEAGGNLKADGGLCYLLVPSEKLAGLVNPDTEHMKYWKLAKSYKPEARKISPVVFLFEQRKCANRTATSYLDCPEKLDFQMFNFSGKPQTVEPELSFYNNGKLVRTECPGRIVLPPVSATPLTVPRGSNAAELSVILKDRAGSGNPLSMTFLNGNSMKPAALELNDAVRWRPNSNGRMRISAVPEENAIRFRTEWEKGGGWVYPEYVLTDKENLSGAVGIAFEIKAKQGNGGKRYLHVQVHLAEKSGNWKGFSFPAPSEEWQKRSVYFPQGDIDFSQIRKIRIGMGPADKSLDYSIREVKLLFK